MTFDRSIQVVAGRDERSSGNGFSCAEILFILGEDDGAVTFAVRTNWLPPSVTGGYIAPATSLRPIDLTFHFETDTLTARQDTRKNCPYVGGTCHAITNYKVGDKLVNVLLNYGTERLWEVLERLYMQEARINRPLRRNE